MNRRNVYLMGGPYDTCYRPIYEGNMMVINGHLYTQSADNDLIFIYQSQPPNTTTMNAQECYDAVIKARNDQDQQVRESVFAGIQKAVKDGDLYYTFTGQISVGLRDQLQEAGFKVTTGSQYNETYTSISWDLA